LALARATACTAWREGVIELIERGGPNKLGEDLLYGMHGELMELDPQAWEEIAAAAQQSVRSKLVVTALLPLRRSAPQRA